MNSAFYFFGGLADVFLSLMLWFILDTEKTATFLVDGDRVYSVTDVIKANHSSVNIDCTNDEEDEEQLEISYRDDASYRWSSGISKRMIEMFFTEVEGLDRDWQQDYDYEDNFDSLEL